MRFVVILSALLALSGPVWGQNSNRPGTLSNAPAPSGFPSNPFRDSENFQIVRISDAVLSGREAGLIHSPRRLDLRFRLYDEKNRSQPGLGTNAGPLRFTLWKEGRQIPVPAGSVFTGDVHLASLPLPRVESSGWADLEIKVGVGPALRLPNAVYYRAQELSVIFIVDQSGSMNDNDPKSIRILAVIDSLQDGALKNTVKEIALVTFGDAAAVALPFTAMARFADIRAAFTPKPASGKTDIPGALKLAASHIQERRPPGKVVAILLTDGASTTPLQNEPQLFQKAGIPLYTVGLRGEKSAEYDEAILKKIAADTGALFSGGQTVDLKSIYQRSLLHGLRESEPVYLFPLSDTLFESEALSVEYDSAAPLTFRASISGAPLEILDSQIDGVHQKFIFTPLPNGTHTVILEWLLPNGQRVVKNRTIRVNGKQNLFKLEDRLAFQKVEAQSLLALSTTLENLTFENTLFHFQFLPVPGAGGGSLATEFFHAEENPVILGPRGARTIQLNLRLGNVPPDLYAGSMILFRNGRAFLANLSAEVEAASYRGPAQDPGNKNFFSRLLTFFSRQSVLMIIVFGLVFLVLWSFTHRLLSSLFKKSD